MSILDFKKLRRDGRVIPEGMTAMEMMQKGWTPDLVTRLEWKDELGKKIELISEAGMLAYVSPDRHFVAVIDGPENEILSVFDESGQQVARVSETQEISSSVVKGRFCWFEKPSIDIGSSFAVVFDSGSPPLYQLDIDTSGAVVSIKPVR